MCQYIYSNTKLYLHKKKIYSFNCTFWDTKETNTKITCFFCNLDKKKQNKLPRRKQRGILAYVLLK